MQRANDAMRCVDRREGLREAVDVGFVSPSSSTAIPNSPFATFQAACAIGTKDHRSKGLKDKPGEAPGEGCQSRSSLSSFSPGRVCKRGPSRASRPQRRSSGTGVRPRALKTSHKSKPGAFKSMPSWMRRTAIAPRTMRLAPNSALKS